MRNMYFKYNFNICEMFKWYILLEFEMMGESYVKVIYGGISILILC